MSDAEKPPAPSRKQPLYDTATPGHPGTKAPAPPAPPSQAEPLSERALREYAQLRQELATVGSIAGVVPLDQSCGEPGRWCLPDVNCSARSTMSDEARTAFEDNRRHCQPVVE